MVSGIKKFQAMIPNELIHLRCAAHVLNLVVNCGIREPEFFKLIEKLRHFCKKIHSSPKLTEYLETQSNIFQEPNIKIVMDVETRWNSTYDMLSTALRIKQSITAVSGYLVSQKETRYESLVENDWELVLNLTEFLEPFYQGNFKVKINYYDLKKTVRRILIKKFFVNKLMIVRKFETK